MAANGENIHQTCLNLKIQVDVIRLLSLDFPD